MQSWFASQPLNVTVLGSLFGGVKLPNIDTDFRSACRHATGLLLAKGHRHIGMIRSRSQLAGDDLALAGMHDAMQAHSGDPLPPPTVMTHNFHVERLTVALDRLFASKQPPTALIVMNNHHFLTTFTHLMSHGIRIPEDVSTICLAYDVLLERLSPLPVCYRVGDRLILELARMIINPSTGRSTKSYLLIPEQLPGKTVATIANP